MELSHITTFSQFRIYELIKSPMQLELELSTAESYGGTPFMVAQFSYMLNHA